MAPQPARFAGSFYTAEPIPLNRQVRIFVQGGKTGADLTPSRPIAVIAPHAGYRFSGALAGQAYAAAVKHDYARIVVLSPSHRYAFDGLAMPSWNQMQVPNGKITVERLLRNQLLDEKLIRIEDAAHDNEHGTETQFPFLARFFQGVPIVPVVVGRCHIAEIARLVDRLGQDPGKPTLFVLSSDLSHFETQAKARKLDLETARMIETADVAALDGKHACGWMPLAGFLASSVGAGARAVRLAMDDSAKATGDKNRVVGYGAWALYSAADPVFNDKHQDQMLNIARRAIVSYLAKGKMPNVHTPSFPVPLQTNMASFVTLTDQGRLRGCIGSLTPHRPLIDDVVENAIKAATQDPRFRPLQSKPELDILKLKIAVLTKPAPMAVSSRAALERQITPGLSGLIIEDQGKRGTFLPMVWDSLRTREGFVNGLLAKAGLPKDHWSPTVRVWHYQAESFAEPQD